MLELILLEGLQAAVYDFKFKRFYFVISQLYFTKSCSVGPFDIELVTLTHSIPEPNAIALRTPLSRLEAVIELMRQQEGQTGSNISFFFLTFLLLGRRINVNKKEMLTGLTHE